MMTEVIIGETCYYNNQEGHTIQSKSVHNNVLQKFNILVFSFGDRKALRMH